MLFDKEGIYDVNLPDIFELSIKNDNSEFPKFYDLDEALNKGNSFPNIYDPYKNYKPNMIKSNSAEEDLLNKIRRLAFAINDLNLYLDLNPEDDYVYKMFKDYMEELMNTEKDYSKMYGPLKLEDLTNSYGWLKSPFPWEDKNV